MQRKSHFKSAPSWRRKKMDNIISDVTDYFSVQNKDNMSKVLPSSSWRVSWNENLFRKLHNPRESICTTLLNLKNIMSNITYRSEPNFTPRSGTRTHWPLDHYQQPGPKHSGCNRPRWLRPGVNQITAHCIWALSAILASYSPALCTPDDCAHYANTLHTLCEHTFRLQCRHTQSRTEKDLGTTTKSVNWMFWRRGKCAEWKGWERRDRDSYTIWSSNVSKGKNEQQKEKAQGIQDMRGFSRKHTAVEMLWREMWQKVATTRWDQYLKGIRASVKGQKV